MCRKACDPLDVLCQHNKTMSVSYQFLALPTIQEVKWPVTLLNISAQGFILTPQMYFYILNGNDDRVFDTVVNSNIALFRLRKPLVGPAEYRVTLRLENRNYVGNHLLAAHNTHVYIDVSGDPF